MKSQRQNTTARTGMTEPANLRKGTAPLFWIRSYFFQRLQESAYLQEKGISGILVIGSFDFNNECIGKERHDAGIMTKNPDLIKSALDLFNKIWEDNESESLLKKYVLGTR
jgi:hypothetical protein